MENLTVIIPIVALDNDEKKNMFINAISSVDDSNTIVVVSSIIPLNSPPITPATATGLFASAITSISSESALSSPSRVVIVSPALAFLTIT